MTVKLVLSCGCAALVEYVPDVEASNRRRQQERGRAEKARRDAAYSLPSHCTEPVLTVALFHD